MRMEIAHGPAVAGIEAGAAQQRTPDGQRARDAHCPTDHDPSLEYLMHPLRMFALASILLLPSGFAAATGGCPLPKVCTPDEYPILRPNGVCPPNTEGDRVERICQ